MHQRRIAILDTAKRIRRLRPAGQLALLAGIVAAGTAARADVVTEWNQIALAATAQTNSAAESRALAIMHAAVFDAVNSIDRRYTPYAVDIKADPRSSIDAAGAKAAHDTLAGLFPAQRATFDAALDATLAKVAVAAERDAGLAVGAEVAEKFLAQRVDDGAARKIDHAPRNGAGQWQPTPPGFAPMVLAQWGEIKTFVLQSPKELNVAGPPALDSAAYTKDLEQVRRLGARDSKERSADQTAAAIFWAINTGVPWNAAARAAATAAAAAATAAPKRGPSVVDNARIFALLNMAGADAYIAALAIKRQYTFWRPVTAIRNAAVDAQPDWEPLLNTPAHPDYVSGHCIYSGAAAQVLRRFFAGDGAPFSATFGGVNGITRRYSGFTQAEHEVEAARVWAGIHFATANAHGIALGRQIADLALRRHLRPLP
jgi:hypothetical protein